MRRPSILLPMLVAALTTGCPNLSEKNGVPYAISVVQALGAARAGFAKDNPHRASTTMSDLEPYLQSWGASSVETRLKKHGANVRFVPIALGSETPELWLIVQKRFFRLPNGAVRDSFVAESTMFVFGVSPSGQVREIDDEKTLTQIFCDEALSPAPEPQRPK